MIKRYTVRFFVFMLVFLGSVSAWAQDASVTATATVTGTATVAQSATVAPAMAAVTPTVTSTVGPTVTFEVSGAVLSAIVILLVALAGLIWRKFIQKPFPVKVEPTPPIKVDVDLGKK